MTFDAKLDVLVDILDFVKDPKRVALLYNDFMQIPMETECVIKEPTYCVPLYRRVYHTHLYLYEGSICEYHDLLDAVGPENFTGTSHYTSVYLKEIFEDYGDDGHVEQRLVGYKFVTEADINDKR